MVCNWLFTWLAENEKEMQKYPELHGVLINKDIQRNQFLPVVYLNSCWQMDTSVNKTQAFQCHYTTIKVCHIPLIRIYSSYGNSSNIWFKIQLQPHTLKTLSKTLLKWSQKLLNCWIASLWVSHLQRQLSVTEMKTIMINTRYLKDGIKKQKPELAL